MFFSPTLIVVDDDEASDAVTTLPPAAHQAAAFIAASHFEAASTHLPVVRFAQLTHELVRDRNLVRVGRAAFQRRLSAWLREGRDGERDGAPPVALRPANGSQADRVELGPCAFNSPGVGVMFTSPRIDAGGTPRLDLVVSGTDDVGLLEITGLRYAFSSQQALTRPIYTNLFPDFAVASAGHWGWRWHAAGRWGNHFEWRDDLVYAECP